MVKQLFKTCVLILLLGFVLTFDGAILAQDEPVDNGVDGEVTIQQNEGETDDTQGGQNGDGEQGGTDGNQDGEVTEVETSKIEGEVTRIEGDKYNIKSTNTQPENLEVTIPSDVKVSRNGLDSSRDEIKVGDKVTIEQSSDGRVLGVSVVSGKVTNTAKIAIPVAIGGLLLLGILMYLFRKGNQGHIKTSSEQVQE